MPRSGAGRGRVTLGWRDRHRRRAASLLAVGLLAVGLLASRFAATPLGLLPAAILPAAAVAALLGQPAHRGHRLWWLETLVCLGLALGSLAGADVWQHVCKAALVLVVIFLLARERSSFQPIAWWGVTTLVICLAGILSVRFVDQQFAPWMALAACVPLLPLAPFHAGYASSLARLPGSTAGFLAVALPLVGLHSAVTLLGGLSGDIWNAIGWIALAGAVWAAMRALVQTDFRGMVTFGSVSLLSLSWWFAAANSNVNLPATAVYVAGVTLAIAGLLAAWQIIRARYGDTIDSRGVSDLVKGMPKFAVLAYILGLAAMGLPPFGPFTGFLNLAFELPLAAWGGLAIVLVVWLVASWYMIGMIHRVLFGRERPELPQSDILPHEVVALVTYVVLLTLIGLVPSNLLDTNSAQPTNTANIANTQEVR